MNIRIGHLKILDHLILALVNQKSTGAVRPPDAPFPEIYLQPLNSWEQIARGLVSRDINGAFINIPLAMSLFHREPEFVLLMFTHRGGSTMIAHGDLKQIRQFKDKSVLIPHKLSIQHMLLHKFLDTGTVEPEVVPSVIMPEMAARDKASDIGALICEEPWATASMDSEKLRPLLTTHALWPDHPCCALVVRKTLLADHPMQIEQLVRYLFSSADILNTLLARNQAPPSRLFALAAEFLNCSPDTAARALSRAGIQYDPKLLVPDSGLLQIIQQYMGTVMEVLPGPIDLDRFIYPGCALNALEEPVP